MASERNGVAAGVAACGQVAMHYAGLMPIHNADIAAIFTEIADLLAGARR